MSQEATATDQFSRSLIARRLITERAGPGIEHYLHLNLWWRWRELPTPRGSFWEYVIKELSDGR